MAAVLFPQPLHLTRVVETPFNGRETVEEYLSGNRVITVSADRTVIVDYDQQTVTEISRRAGTYSITPFEKLARASQASRRGVSATAKMPAASDWDVRDSSRPAGRERGEYSVARPPKASAVVEMQVGVDPAVQLSRAAIEVLVGATYPQSESVESTVAMRAITRRGGVVERRLAAQSAGATETFALPIEQSVTYATGDGENVTVRNRVTRVGNELPPPDVASIPAGAKLIASPAVETQRRLEELEQVAPPNR